MNSTAAALPPAPSLGGRGSQKAEVEMGTLRVPKPLRELHTLRTARCEGFTAPLAEPGAMSQRSDKSEEKPGTLRVPVPLEELVTNREARRERFIAPIAESETPSPLRGEGWGEGDPGRTSLEPISRESRR